MSRIPASGKNRELQKTYQNSKFKLKKKESRRRQTNKKQQSPGQTDSDRQVGKERNKFRDRPHKNIRSSILAACDL
jgi:hypothetical protein